MEGAVAEHVRPFIASFSDSRGNDMRSEPGFKHERYGFVARVGIVVAAVTLAFIAWQTRTALIVLFGGIVVAVLLTSIADPIAEVGLPRPLAVLAAVVAIAALFAGFGWFVWPKAELQGQTLLSALPSSLADLESRLLSWLPEDAMMNGGILSDIAARIAAWSGMMLGAATSVVLIVSLGVFLAIRPGLYRDGAVRLIPPASQAPVRDALDHAGHLLKAWLRAKLASMAVIGCAVGLATWALGLPAPFALGLIAGLFAFVPILGPIAAAVPGLLLALTISPATVLWTALAYFAVEQLESNIVLPLLEGEAADVPPALLIFAFAATGLVFGIPGIIVTAPLTVALYSLVTDLYVRPLNESAGGTAALDN